MIPNKEKEGWYYLAVKQLSTILRGMTSKHHGDIYYLNCVHSFSTENKIASHEKVCKNKDLEFDCGIVMPSEKDNILEFNQFMKSEKMSYIIYYKVQIIQKILLQ